MSTYKKMYLRAKGWALAWQNRLKSWNQNWELAIMIVVHHIVWSKIFCPIQSTKEMDMNIQQTTLEDFSQRKEIFT